MATTVLPPAEFRSYHTKNAHFCQLKEQFVSKIDMTWHFSWWTSHLLHLDTTKTSSISVFLNSKLKQNCLCTIKTNYQGSYPTVNHLCWTLMFLNFPNSSRGYSWWFLLLNLRMSGELLLMLGLWDCPFSNGKSQIKAMSIINSQHLNLIWNEISESQKGFIWIVLPFKIS